MARLTVADYRQQLQDLLPHGPAWQFEKGSRMLDFIHASAIELTRVDGRVGDMVAESLPGQAYETLTEWEEVAGLPDLCTGSETEISARQKALVGKLTASGGQSIAYFLQILANMGYPEATIEEPQMMTCNDDCNAYLWDELSIFCWIVNIPQSVALSPMTCNDNCNSFLNVYGIDAVECVLNRIKPSHTHVGLYYDL